MAQKKTSPKSPTSNAEPALSDGLIDVGVLFHEHAATLTMILQAIKPVIKALGPNPFEDGGEPAIEEIEEKLVEPVSSLIESLRNLIRNMDTDWRERGLSEDQWDALCEIYDVLLDYKNRANLPVFRPPFLRQSARKLIDLLQSDATPKFPSSVLVVTREARLIERLVCFYDLSHAKARILSMEQQARALRDYVTASVSPSNEKDNVRIREVINKVRAELDAFSKQRKVRIELKPSPDALVKCDVNAVRRAFSNILNNAIKYSYQLSGDGEAWVTLNVFIKKGQVCVSTENWGVPIKKEEIEQELIFELGYRGELSSDRTRSGSGIGLFDARKTARQHGGDVVVRSVPSRRDLGADPYAQPYITIVTLMLPFVAELR